MLGAKLLAMAAVVQGQSCVIEVQGVTFDFSSLSGKQISFQERNYTYDLTFCQNSPESCGSPPASSLCQTVPPWQFSLGVWSEFQDWRVSSGELTGTLVGEFCESSNRVTNVTFHCADGVPSFVSVLEVMTCQYQMVIQVPLEVCGATSTCCAPKTYTSTRMEIGGARAVVQRDGITGDWFDGNYQARGQRLLCSTYYNRCFTYPPSLASCVGSAYRPAPVQCFGGTDWAFIAQQPLADSLPVMQSMWTSKLDGNYVVTMPLSTSPDCVPVSGSAIDTSVAFSLNPDQSLWEVPQICLKDLHTNQKF